MNWVLKKQKHIDNVTHSFTTVLLFIIETALSQQTGQQHESKQLRDRTVLVKRIKVIKAKSLLRPSTKIT